LAGRGLHYGLMDSEYNRERIAAAALFAAAALALIGIFSSIGRTVTLPRTVPPALIGSPIESTGPAALLEKRRSKLLLRAETETRAILNFGDVIAARRAAYRIEEGLLRSKSQADLDEWERNLDAFLDRSRAPAANPAKI
jgi:hypothetical protein